MMRFLLLWAELPFGLVLSWSCVKSVLFVLLYFTHKTRGFPVKMQFICYWNFQCKKKKYPKSSPPLRARACVCMSSILHIFVRVFIRFVLRSTCALTPLALRDPLAHLRLESIFKSRVRARRVKRTTSKASKALHLYRVMRVDTSGFREPYRLHSSFVGVTRSWTLTRADRETDLHRDLLAPRLYLENPVSEVIRCFGQVCVCVCVCVCVRAVIFSQRQTIVRQSVQKCPRFHIVLSQNTSLFSRKCADRC